MTMNSMAEMHAEIAERDRVQHEREGGTATWEDELQSLEREFQETQARLAGLRRKCSDGGWREARREQPNELAT
jgi:hypothetical protein